MWHNEFDIVEGFILIFTVRITAQLATLSIVPSSLPHETVEVDLDVLIVPRINPNI